MGEKQKNGQFSASFPLPSFRVVTSLHDIKGLSIQTSLSGVCESEGCLKFKQMTSLKNSVKTKKTTTTTRTKLARQNSFEISRILTAVKPETRLQG